jgi:hypothetical protein
MVIPSPADAAAHSPARLGLPPQLASLSPSGDLPTLPETALSLYTSEASASPAVARLREILLDELSATL